MVILILRFIKWLIVHHKKMMSTWKSGNSSMFQTVVVQGDQEKHSERSAGDRWY